MEFASVAVQVLVITLLLPTPFTTTSEYPVVGVAQLSVAIAGPLVEAGKILAEQEIVIFAGDKVIVGGVVSVTVMV